MERQEQDNLLAIKREHNRRYAANYRRNSPEKCRANELRYYARRLIAAGYTVTEPAANTSSVDVKSAEEAEAKWIYGEDETGVDGWYCSECNFFEPWFYDFTDDIDFIRFYGHCPKCGRRMTSYTGKPAQERR